MWCVVGVFALHMDRAIRILVTAARLRLSASLSSAHCGLFDKASVKASPAFRPRLGRASCGSSGKYFVDLWEGATMLKYQELMKDGEWMRTVLFLSHDAVGFSQSRCAESAHKDIPPQCGKTGKEATALAQSAKCATVRIRHLRQVENADHRCTLETL